MLFYYFYNGAQLQFFESVSICQPDRAKPKFCRAIAFLNVNVRRFVSFLTVEEKLETTDSQNCWHFVITISSTK